MFKVVCAAMGKNSKKIQIIVKPKGKGAVIEKYTKLDSHAHISSSTYRHLECYDNAC